MNYKKIGDYIQQVNLKNEGGEIKNLLGVNLDKVFMSSVANLNGVDITKYKIIKKGQFGCKLMSVGRDKKLPISHLTDYDKAIISSAYYVFEVKNEKELLPEYLMMWFLRPESDRFLWFLSGGDVRGRITWDDLCTLPIRIPSIEKQQQIVDEYNTVTNRIQLNEKINANLEATAQALYKHWFVDFEFPNKDGKPYKSSGGEMVYNEELDKDIPVGWKNGYLDELIKITSGFAFKSLDFSEVGSYPILKIKNVQPPSVSLKDSQFYNNVLTERLKRVLIKKGDVLITMTGSGANQLNSAVGQVGRYYFGSPSLLNQRVCKILTNDPDAIEFVYLFLSNKETHMELLAGSSGSANQANISPNQIKNLETIIPESEVLQNFHSKVSLIFNSKRTEQQISLSKLKDVILSKMSMSKVAQKPQAV